MSYEGYVEYLCENGHRCGHDCYDTEPTECPDCGGKLKWHHSVDQTNGEIEDDPHTLPAPVTITRTDDVWHEDHHGNKYAIKSYIYEPDSPEWHKL